MEDLVRSLPPWFSTIPLNLLAFGSVLALLTGAIYFFLPNKQSQKQSSKSDNRKHVFNPARANASLQKLEGELRMQVFDPAARERLIKDAIKRRNCDRTVAIRVVLEELDDEHKRYG